MYTIEQLLGFMTEHDASDLYITEKRPPCFKVNGLVKPAGQCALTTDVIESLVASVMDDEQQKHFREKREQNVALELPDVGRFRINAYYQKNAMAMVIRKIVTEIPTMDELKLPKVLKDVAMAKRGLVLVVGATGSGKSTSLAAMIDHRNQNEAGHIMTIEDPVEFVHDHKNCVVSQREVGVDTESFHDALRNALRQAPTVILIGEIRDEETMEHAINFAETGHLCLATLHSNNANQAIERVINFFPPERHRQIYMQLSLNLQGIISQRLVRTTDGGRAAAIEILRGSARVRDLIRRGEADELKEAMEAGSIEGMQTFDQALMALYRENRISMEECLQNADNPTDLKIKLKLEEAGNPDANGSSGEEEGDGMQFAT